MKMSFVKILFIAGVMISVSSLMAQTAEHSTTTRATTVNNRKSTSAADSISVKSKNANKTNSKTKEDKNSATRSASPGTNGPNSGSDPLGTGK